MSPQPLRLSSSKPRSGENRQTPWDEIGQEEENDEGEAAPPLPNDPFLSSSGSWGQDFPDLWGLLQIEAPAAWERSQGEGVVVAVIDTGIDITHPDLAANVWHNAGEIPGNGIDEDGNGFVDDVDGWDFTTCQRAFSDGDCFETKEPGPDVIDEAGHGTHVAGTIAAVGDNDLGIIGVAPQAQVMAVKGLNARGQGRNADLALALVYAAENGAQVINASWSGPPSDTIKLAIDYVTETFDVVVVAAAGNDAAPLERGAYPANLPTVLAVGATTHTDETAAFSNFGGPLDMVAPGGGDTGPASVVDPRRSILSLVSRDATGLDAISTECHYVCCCRFGPPRCGEPECQDAEDRDCEDRCTAGPWVIAENYVRASGTSFAAPHVAGTAALVRSRHPGFSQGQVRQVLRNTADDLGPSGWDEHFGYGRVNAAQAVASDDLPVAEILTPENRGKVWERDFPLTVIGTVTPPTAGLTHWSLTIRPQAGGNAVELANGSSAVGNGPLGTVDLGAPLALEPGQRYVLDLAAEDTAGHLAHDSKMFLIPNPQYAVVPVPDVFDDGGGNPTFSADGRRLALTRTDRDPPYNQSIWFFDTTTRTHERIANSTFPTLSSNGRFLLYASADYQLKNIDESSPFLVETFRGS